MLELLSSTHGINRDLSCEELLNYLSGPTYEEDVVSVEDVLSNELLLLHEVAEACILKSMGYNIGRDTVMKAYPHTYAAHLNAVNIELSEALRRHSIEHIKARCKDLKSYLSDPHLPENLVSNVQELISKYCRNSSIITSGRS